MSDPKIKVVIPFRDRGIDLRRSANLEIVLAWWWTFGFEPVVVSDGGEGDDQFNRHKAYNLATETGASADVFVFTEADMLVPPPQIATAIRVAAHQQGLVVPFTEYRYLSDVTTTTIRDLYHDATTEYLAEWFKAYAVFGAPAEWIKPNGRNIGAINVVSRETLEATGGFTEATSGNWYDDDIINEGFAFLTGNKTAHVPGPAVHLYHLPGYTGEHLTDEDRFATAQNKRLLDGMREAIKNGNRHAVHEFMRQRG